MNTIFSRLTPIIFIAFLSLSCSSDDDEANDSALTISNKALIIGQWYKIDSCAEQNNYTFNTNLNYELLDSNNTDCNDNEYNTYKLTGTYNIIENELFFNQQTEELIIQGEALTTNDFETNLSIKYIIEVLNETNLRIKITRTSDYGVNTYTNNYQR